MNAKEILLQEIRPTFALNDSKFVTQSIPTVPCVMCNGHKEYGNLIKIYGKQVINKKFRISLYIVYFIITIWR